MKKTLLLVALICPLIAFSNPTTHPALPNVIVKFSPQHMVRSGLWLSGEFFNEKHSMSNQLSLEAIYAKPVGSRIGITESSGFTAEYMFKFYSGRMHVQKTMQKEFVKGVYVGLFGQAGSYNQKDRQLLQGKESITTIKSSTFYPGFILGTQQSIGESFFIDIYLGAGMRVSKPTITSDNPNYDLSNMYFLYNNGVFPKIGMSFGFGF